MSQSLKNKRKQRRPQLQATKSGPTVEAGVPVNQPLARDSRVPSGIELTPIPPHIVQSVMELLAARRVDVESLIH